MRTVWALAKLVVRESFRKRLLILLAITIAVIWLVPFVLPAMDQAGRIQIAQSWLMSCITFFGVITAFFIAGTSLPGDLREGRLFLLFTKPVHRSTYILSKFLGFALVFVIFIGVAGGMGYAMLLYLDPGRDSSSMTVRKKISAGTFEFDKQGSVNKRTFRGETVEEDGTERIVVSGSSTTTPIARWTFERKPGWTYEAPPEALLDFNGRGPRGEFSVKLRFIVFIGKRVKSEDPNKKTTLEWQRVQREIKDIRQNQIARFTILPERYEDTSKMNSVFDEAERVRIFLSLVNPAASVRFHRDSLRITGPEEPFVINYARALFMVFLLLIYLSAFLMAVTPVLSGPVSICLGLLFYMIGSMSTFFRDALSVTQSTIEARLEGVASRGHSHLPNPDLPTWALQYGNYITEWVLAVVPSFDVFYQQAPLMEGWHIPASTLYNGIGVALPSVLLFVVVGAVLFQVREISS